MKELHNTGVELKEITEEIFDRVARMKYEDNIDELKKLLDEIGNISPEQFEIVTV